jgi:pimeloyl-ACP methyl ester carboxylesterase
VTTRPLRPRAGFLFAPLLTPGASGQGDHSGYRRIYIDLPGTGRSPAGEPHSDRVLLDVVATIRRELTDEPFAIIGWSYGGFLAAGVARRLASRTRGLMMVCSGFRIRPEDRDLAGVLSSEPETDWLVKVAERWHEHFRQAIGRRTAEVAQQVASVLENNDATDDRYLSDLRANGFVLSDEETPVPGEIPMCFLTGRRDRVAGYAGLFNALDLYAHADYVVSSRAGHYLPLEERELFASTLHNWLDRCGGRAARW